MMRIQPKLILFCLGSLSLSGCMIDGTTSEQTNYSQQTAPGSTLYPESYESNIDYSLQGFNQSNQLESADKRVVVPESYHVGPNHSPTPAFDADKSWVSSQNPQAYTILLAKSDKASQVANILFKAPKREHTAEVQSQHGNRIYYQGFYGSYPNYEAAQQALNALPDDIRQHAGIEAWGRVQNNM